MTFAQPEPEPQSSILAVSVVVFRFLVFQYQAQTRWLSARQKVFFYALPLELHQLLGAFRHPIRQP